MKIGIIIGSIREGRFGGAVGQWVKEATDARASEGFTYEVLDLKDFNVPLLTAATPPMGADKQYDDENVTRWSKAVDSCDGFIFVTAEYNRGVPGAFKNAYDNLGPEWQGKPVAFVSYGGRQGVRSVEQWRQIVNAFEQQPVQSQVSVSIFEDADQDGFSPQEHRAEELQAMLADLESLMQRTAE